MKLLFPGSFDPFTRGHADIVRRALKFADEVVVAVGAHPTKHGLFSVDERMTQIRKTFEEEPRVSVISYQGLTTELAASLHADSLLRGVRTVADYEYERQMAEVNRRLTNIETILLLADPTLADISSSVVRELMSYHQDVSQFLP